MKTIDHFKFYSWRICKILILEKSNKKFQQEDKKKVSNDTRVDFQMLYVREHKTCEGIKYVERWCNLSSYL